MKCITGVGFECSQLALSVPACGSGHQLLDPCPSHQASTLPPRTLHSRALIRVKMVQVPPPCVLAKTFQV